MRYMRPYPREIQTSPEPLNDNYTHMLYNNQGLNILRDKIPVKVSSLERRNGQRVQMLLKSASVFMRQLICEILQAA